MRVTHLDVPGQLLSHGDEWLTFVPDDCPWGDKRVTIHDPTVRFCGAEDDHCIWVKGRIAYNGVIGRDTLWQHTEWSFYLITS